MDAQSAGLPRKRQLKDNVTERVANATARPFSTPRLAATFEASKPSRERNGAEAPSAVSLLTLSGISPWVEAAFAVVVGATVLCGLCEVATANLDKPILSRRLLLAGTVLSVICVAVFIATRQPYAGIVCFALLLTKSLMLSKHVR